MTDPSVTSNPHEKPEPTDYEAYQHWLATRTHFLVNIFWEQYHWRAYIPDFQPMIEVYGRDREEIETKLKAEIVLYRSDDPAIYTFEYQNPDPNAVGIFTKGVQ